MIQLLDVAGFRTLQIGIGMPLSLTGSIVHLSVLELQLEQPQLVAQRLGHRDAMVTATIYAHVSNEQDETASQKFADASKRAI